MTTRVLEERLKESQAEVESLRARLRLAEEVRRLRPNERQGKKEEKERKKCVARAENETCCVHCGP